MSDDYYETQVEQLLALMKKYDEEITSYLYYVLVPQAATVSIETLRYTGTRISGIKHIDEALMKEPRRVMISIRTMVAYHLEGYYVKIPSMEDSTKIYDTVCNYLKVWKIYSDFVVNKSDDNLDFLLALDSMACYLFPQIVHTFEPVKFVNTTVNKLTYDSKSTAETLFKTGPVNLFKSRTGTVSGNNRNNNSELKDVVIDKLNNKVPERKSMSEFIIDNFGK